MMVSSDQCGHGQRSRLVQDDPSGSAHWLMQNQLVGHMTGWSDGWLAGFGWLAGWSVSWLRLVGSLVRSLVGMEAPPVVRLDALAVLAGRDTVTDISAAVAGMKNYHDHQESNEIMINHHHEAAVNR